MFLLTDSPSVKTLGYSQEAQTPVICVALTMRREAFGISLDDVYWTKVQYLLSHVPA